MSYTAVGLVYLYVHNQECGMKAAPLRRVPAEKRHLPPRLPWAGWAEDTIYEDTIRSWPIPPWLTGMGLPREQNGTGGA